MLNLYLVVQGTLVQAQTREGRLLLTPEQEAQARRRAEEERTQEVEARRRAEEQVEQLRRELQQYKSEGGSD